MKKMSITKENGITLIALIITIILMLILASVVINSAFGNKGIFKVSKKAAEDYKISQILEDLETEKMNLILAKRGNNPTVQEYIDYIVKKGKTDASTVEEIDENNKNIIVEDYKFLVEKEKDGNIKITYNGTAEKNPMDDILSESDIEFSQDIEGWTTQNVTVTVSPKVTLKDGNYLETSIDGGKNWSNNTKPVLENNGFVLVRVSNGEKNSNTIASYEVTNIDKEGPVINSVTPRAVDGIFNVRIGGADDKSGVKEMCITEYGTEPSDWRVASKSSGYENDTFDLPGNGHYQAWLKDDCGNISEGFEFTTGEIPLISSIQLFAVSQNGNEVYMSWETGTHGALNRGVKVGDTISINWYLGPEGAPSDSIEWTVEGEGILLMPGEKMGPGSAVYRYLQLIMTQNTVGVLRGRATDGSDFEVEIEIFPDL